MLREESEVYSLEEQEEMPLSVVFGILAPSQFTYPEVESCKNTKYRTHGQHIMKMCYDVVSHLLRCLAWRASSGSATAPRQGKASVLLVLPQGPDFLLSRF